MKRSLTLLAATASVFALSACAFDTTAPEEGETIESVEQALEFDSRDALLSALGSATLDCLGTVDPGSYSTKTGALTRTFDKCPTGSQTALGQIDALLGVQNSKQGQADKLASHYVNTWGKYVKGFPSEIKVCPTWGGKKVINPPTFENVKKHIEGKDPVGKENYTYKVASEQCGKDAKCTVKHALACAGGFGSQFLISGDAETSSVLVDPAWWNTTWEFADDASNPFMTPGYYHGMSYYGTKPGALYGAVQRAGEVCSKWSEIAGKHYLDRKLVEIDCGGGWYCMSYCM